MRAGDYAASKYSQFGEDGILRAIFDRLSISEGYLVEFGAWDGIHLSNSRSLRETGWQGCLIEGDPKRFDRLQRNVPDERVKKVNAFIQVDGARRLDAILAAVDAPRDFDLLSIDIDSDDLAVWQSVNDHSAKCVVIEYNETIPFDTPFVNRPGKNWGNSALSIYRFATGAGYALVAGTRANLIFLRRDIMMGSDIDGIGLSDLETNLRTFWGMDGSLLRVGTTSHAPDQEIFTVPWNGFVTCQPVPKFMRSLAPKARPIRRVLGLGLLAMCRPVAFAQTLCTVIRTKIGTKRR